MNPKFAKTPIAMAGGIGMPGAGAFNRARVTNPNDSEIVRQRLYDHLLYLGAGQQNLNFFSQARGAGITTAPGAVVGTPKTLHDTNLDIANTLPSGKEYLIETIEVYFYPGSSAAASTFTPVFGATLTSAVLDAAHVDALNDVQAFYESGLLQFVVLDKPQLTETPLRSFPPKTNMEFNVSVSAAAGAGAAIQLLVENARPVGRPYILEPQISLQPASNFSVTLNWPSALALPSGKNARVGVYFDGYLKRAAQ